MKMTQFPITATRLGVPAPRPRAWSEPVTLVTSVGTAFLSLLEYLALFPRAVILAIDVPDELARLRLGTHPDRFLFTIPIGQEHTVQAIVAAHGTPAQKSSLALLPSAGSSEGMAQLRGIGAAAMRQLIKRHEVQRLLREQILPLMTVLGGGDLSMIRHVHLQGTAGGMGSEGGIVLYDEVIRALLEENNSVIHSEVHLLGGLTYNGPDFPRVRENSAAALAQWIDKCRHPASSQVWISLYCSELLPVGKNKRQRDALLIEQYQALLAAAAEGDLRFNRSNETVSGQWGNVRLVQADHFRALPQRQIVADVARAYRPIITDMLRTTADLGRVHAFRWLESATPLPRESVGGALERVLEADADDILASISRPAKKFKLTPIVVLRDGRELPLDNVRATFASPLSTVQDTRQRICLLRTCRLACRQQREELLARIADLVRKIARLERQARRAIRALQGLWLLSLVLTDATKIDRALRVLSALQAAWDALHEAEERLEVIESSIRQLSAEIRDLTGKLKRLARLLRRALPQGDAHQHQPVIDPCPLDQLFPNLLDHVERPVDYAHFLHLLAQGIEHVKPRGLAQIVGAPDTSVEAIVRATVACTHAIHGPYWGGAVREDQARRFVVFPPVETGLARGIVEHHQGLPDAFGTVAFAQTAVGSVNVVIAEVTACRELRDVWVSHYEKGLTRALQNDLRSLFVSDVEPLRQLGLIADGTDDRGRGNGQSIPTPAADSNDNK